MLRLPILAHWRCTSPHPPPTAFTGRRDHGLVSLDLDVKGANGASMGCELGPPLKLSGGPLRTDVVTSVIHLSVDAELREDTAERFNCFLLCTLDHGWKGICVNSQVGECCVRRWTERAHSFRWRRSACRSRISALFVGWQVIPHNSLSLSLSLCPYRLFS